MTQNTSHAAQAGLGSRSSSSTIYAQRKRAFTRETILDAAEALMAKGEKADFSMRDLATEAGMAVTTVFSHFGSKAGVLRGLIDRLIDRIEAVYDGRAQQLEGAIARTFAMAQIGVEIVLDDPGFNQRILGSLLMVGDDRVYSELQRQTDHLWIKALGEGEDLIPATRHIALACLPNQMTVTFRGALALWIAEGLPEDRFRQALLYGVAVNLLGFVSEDQKQILLERFFGNRTTA